ncbi:hypothetical protein AVEN_255879-1 [Araneus ventricosus]|uniref:Uncharacterized protein n=1 Tax=Araneus ventricosus TaxID=182803 RepID=A0A4Y2DFC6_ARAVE|nr:hypothetical protein AVEN_255879-1 [Araneus ventricosus]
MARFVHTLSYGEETMPFDLLTLMKSIKAKKKKSGKAKERSPFDFVVSFQNMARFVHTLSYSEETMPFDLLTLMKSIEAKRKVENQRKGLPRLSPNIHNMACLTLTSSYSEESHFHPLSPSSLTDLQARSQYYISNYSGT